MPRIIVTLDPLTSDPSGETPVLLDEQVRSVHLSTGHAAAQLVERLAWAVGDAESAEIARSGPHRAREQRPARARRPPTRSRPRRAVGA